MQNLINLTKDYIYIILSISINILISKMNNSNKLIGINIAKYRKLKGMSQSELAKLLGITTPTMSNVETGKSELKSGKLILLCEILKIDLNDLTGK